MENSMMIREPGQRAFSPKMWDVLAYAFGCETDGDIARAIGVTPGTVRFQREKRGIRAARRVR